MSRDTDPTLFRPSIRPALCDGSTGLTMTQRAGLLGMTRKNALIMFFLLTFFFCSSSIFAQSPTLLPTQKSLAPYLTHLRFIQELKPTQEKPIQFIPLGINENIPPGSHLRVLYTSHNPLPLEIGFRPQPETDFVTAILPPAEKGDVLLPLTVSPSWKWNLSTIVVNAYTLENEFPEKIDVQMIDLLNPWQRFLIYMVQPWTSEVFGSSSINFLYGYRSAGIPLTLILAIITIVISLIVFVIQRKIVSWFVPSTSSGQAQFTMTRSIAAICFAMILLYQARFMTDLVPETFARTREWLTDRTYGEMTYMYQVAEILKKESKNVSSFETPSPLCHGEPCRTITKGWAPQDDILSVATCKDSATALGYLLHPISVRVEEESWKTATHAVVTLYPWEEVPGTFTCHDIARPASIVKQFPTGDTVIRFTDIRADSIIKKFPLPLESSNT